MPDNPNQNINNNSSASNTIQSVTQIAANVNVQNLPQDQKVHDDVSATKLEAILGHVANIDAALDKLVKGGVIPSQTNAQHHINNVQYNNHYGQFNQYSQYGYSQYHYGQHNYNGWNMGGYGSGHHTTGYGGHYKDMFSNMKGQGQNFIDALEDGLIDGFIGSDFKDEIKEMFNDFANEIGVPLKDIPGQIGKNIGQNIMKEFLDKSGLGSVVDSYKTKFKDWLKDQAFDKIKDLVNGDAGKQLGSAIGNAVKGNPAELIAMGKGALTAINGIVTKIPVLGTAASGASGALTAFAGIAVPEAVIAIGIVVVALHALSVVTDNVKKAFEGVKDLVAGIKKTTVRNQTSLEKNVKLARTRLEADVRTMVEKPFQILQEAAQAWYSTWDNNLKVINATQGYTKADLQDLMSAYSSRLQSEGLTAYISGASISDNLAKVLESGLSGAAAEEFAYQATKLNAAVPTQDFFSYASTYASIAANAMKAGDSQAEALEKANKSLTSFTSGLLYASRQLSGGFTTGLRDASTIYEQAARIAQASKTGEVANISSVLLAVRGEVGAVAPDLASSITDTIYKMLAGGNSSDVVALRSLAGVNASNTEFLKAAAENPQKIFSTLFANLGNMYNDSSDAYMEKAAGYAELFGMSSEAFQRIDFNSLSEAISSMNMSDASLNENMKLLVQGQTTTTAEQLRNQQINQYMIEEGLSTVLDNDSARAIQQHMWDEQLGRELMEATYAVDLQGDAAEAIAKILNAVNNIALIINPLGALKKVGNLILTATEAVTERADIAQMLELGKVGNNSNAKELYNLTTMNTNLNLTKSLVEQMGGVGLYGANAKLTRGYNNITDPVNYTTYGLANGKVLKAVGSAIASAIDSSANRTTTVNSQYNWGSAGKSAAASAASLLNAGPSKEYAKVETSSGKSAVSSSVVATTSSINKMLSDEYLVEQYVKLNKSYDEWAASASKFGISNLDQAIADAGYNPTDIENYFKTKEAEQGAAEQMSIREQEKLFRETGISFWEEKFWTEYKDPMFVKLDDVNTNLTTINTALVDFKDNKFGTDFLANRWDAQYGSEGAAWNKEFAAKWSKWIGEGKSGWNDLVAGPGGDLKGGILNRFLKYFVDYFVRHETYDKAYSFSAVSTKKRQLEKEEKQDENGDLVTALADQLTSNMVDLKDPTVQTNALLAQILIFVKAIDAEINNPSGATGTSTLLGTLSGMALGLYGNASNSSDSGASSATAGKQNAAQSVDTT